MKKALVAVAVAAAVVAGAAVAASRPVSDAEVQAAVDARLHELLRQQLVRR